MANMYGHAGRGAVEEAIESAVRRSSPRKPAKATQSGFSKVLEAVTAFFAIFSFFSLITGEFTSFFITTTVAIVFYIINSQKFSQKKKQKEIDSEYNDIIDNIRAQVVNDYEQYRSGNRLLDQTGFTDQEKRWIEGAIGEEKTSLYLKNGLDNRFTVIDDIKVKNKGGQASANIDHLVLSEDGMIMVDTKVWNAQLPFVHDDNGRSYIPRSSYYWSSVSTCMYEQSQLPTRVRAIIFAIDGKSKNYLPQQGEYVTHYFNKYPKTGQDEIEQTTIPVFFVKQEDISLAVENLDKKLGRGDLSTVEQLQGLSWISF